jgi:membrane protease YdiL (CAAX protease family)
MKISAAYKGVITGVVMIATALVAYLLLKLPVNQKEQYVLYAVFTAGIVWSLMAEKKNNTIVSFKDHFEIGFRTFLIATLLMVIFTFIYFKFDTSYIDNLIKENNALLVAEKQRTPIEIEDNAKNIKKMFLPSLLIAATFKYLIVGAIVTAVGASFISQQKAKG